MWSIAAETKALALAPARHIWCRAIVGSKNGNAWENDRNYYETDYIVSVAVDIGARSGGIQIGGAYCAKLVLRLLDGADIRQTDRIIMRVGFYKPDGSKSEHISLGWFYVDSIKKTNGIYTVTAYDKMLRAQKNYRSALEYPAKISAVLEEICGKLGVNLASDFVILEDGNISLKPVKGRDAEGNEIYYTMRQTLSFLASAMGGKLFFDAGGHLQLTKFAKVSDVFAADNSIEADISADAYSVAGIVWTIGGVTYSRNDENTAGIMEFENPLTFYPKETVQHAIEERVTGLSYHDGTISRQGCGWFELGDIVTAYRADGSSADLLITGISYEIKNGGFTEKIYSSARSESQDNFTTGDIPGSTEPQSVSGAPQANTAGAISSYEYISDPSVKINSLTYTVEKNAAGLITKITDSLGNTLKPTISGEITDIALHNAALWGAVMARGIWSSRVNPNLLDNSDFMVNQRGQSSYSGEGYTVDRWKQDSRTKVTAEADGIRVECIRSTAEPWAGVAQIAEAPFVMGDSYTISLYVADILGVWRLRSDNAADGVELKLTAGLNVLTFSVAKLKPGSFSNNGININITSETRAGDYFKLQWAKLEGGETATEYTAPDPADELRACQRFYQIHSSGSLSPDELDPPMRATPTVTRLSDGNYAYSADL